MTKVNINRPRDQNGKGKCKPCRVYSWSFADFDGVVSCFGHDRGPPAEWDSRWMAMFFPAILVACDVRVCRYSVVESRQMAT